MLLLCIFLFLLFLVPLCFLSLLGIFEFAIFLPIKLPSPAALILRVPKVVSYIAILARLTLGLVFFLTIFNTPDFVRALGVAFQPGCGHGALVAFVVRNALWIIGILVLASFRRIENFPIRTLALSLQIVIVVIRFVWYTDGFRGTRLRSCRTFLAFAIALITKVLRTAPILNDKMD